MKKTYITPQTEIIKIMSEQLLAASPESPSIRLKDDFEGTLGSAAGREDNASSSQPNAWDQGW